MKFFAETIEFLKNHQGILQGALWAGMGPRAKNYTRADPDKGNRQKKNSSSSAYNNNQSNSESTSLVMIQTAYAPSI